MTVKESEGDEFETQVREQLRLVTENETGTVLYLFNRRGPDGSTILPAPPRDHREYIHLMAYTDEAAWTTHFEAEKKWWMPTFQKFMAAPFYTIGFQQDDVVDAVTRDQAWNPNEMFRFAFHKFRVPDEKAAEFEVEAKHQLQIVKEKEPGTVLYSFFRRPKAASGLLPAPLANQTEYFHLMAYNSEEAQAHHRTLEFLTDTWSWGPVFRNFLASPLENEAFDSSLIIAGITRDANWTA